jgi:hypothetical protein
VIFGLREYLIAGLALACLLLGVGWYAERAGHAVTRATFAAEKDKAAREFAQAARAKEQAHAQAIAEIDAKHQRELTDAQAKGERVAAELRSGALRLRREWAGCETDKRVSEASASARSADDLARLRSEGAANLIRYAAQCDARIRALQDVVRSR